MSKENEEIKEAPNPVSLNLFCIVFVANVKLNAARYDGMCRWRVPESWVPVLYVVFWKGRGVQS